MILHEVEQTSAEWWQLRLGTPTASNFDKLITKTGKLSAQADGYIDKLLAEWLLQAPIDDYTSRAMERGIELEPEAWASYEFLCDINVERGGFCTTDGGRVGCSPDGRIYEAGELVGGIELKCPNPATHVGYLRGDRTVADAYKHQVQGCMWVTGAHWWDAMSYHPSLPPSIVRVERDDAYQALLTDALTEFCDRLDAAKATLLDRGCKPTSHHEEAA